MKSNWQGKEDKLSCNSEIHYLGWQKETGNSEGDRLIRAKISQWTETNLPTRNNNGVRAQMDLQVS